MDVVTHIRSLLYYHDCVIIPDFGGLVTNYVTAQKYQHRFHPPSKTIAFNRRIINNDGLLINQIAIEENLGYKAAKEKVSAFTNRIINQLEEKNLVVLPYIGKFYYDDELLLQFIPDDTENYLTDTYGLEPIQASPIIRKENLQQPITMEDFQFEKEEKQQKAKPEKIKRSKRKVALLAATVILLSCLLAYQWFFHDIKITDIKTQFTDLAGPLIEKIKGTFSDKSLQAEKDSLEKSIAEAERLIEELTEATRSINTDTVLLNAEKDTAATIDTPTTIVKAKPIKELTYPYHIIVGSFKGKKDALRYMDKIRKGNNPKILKGGLGYRVSINTYASEEIAAKNISTIRRNYVKQAWVLKE